MTRAAHLHVLRHQAGALAFDVARSSGRATPPVLTTVASSPATRKDNELRQRVASLRRLLGQREALLETPGNTGLRTDAAPQDRSLPGVEVARGVYLIERSYALPRLPDSVTLAPLRSLPQQRHARLHDPNGESSVSCNRLLAIDTETTGLAGGTGTRAFMIGVADLIDQRLRVRQLLTTTLGGEASMLRMFCVWLRADHVLVSYNGRSYDRPLLSTRLRLARLTDPLPALPHLDLLHIVRRAYRSEWPNCRLATAERELLGVVRDDDLPGSEAPAAWLTYLRGGSSALLKRVAAHNDQDLRSLMGLLAHFANAPS